MLVAVSGSPHWGDCVTFDILKEGHPLVTVFIFSSPRAHDHISDDSSQPSSSTFTLPQRGLITMGIMLKKPADAPGSAAPAIMVGLFVAFGGVLYGYVVQTPSINVLLTFADTTLVLSVAFSA
jgi:hypothetical protein